MVAALIFSHSMARAMDAAHLENLFTMAAKLPDFDQLVERPDNDEIAIRNLETIRYSEAKKGFRAFCQHAREQEHRSPIPLYGKLLDILLQRIEANEQMKVPRPCTNFGPRPLGPRLKISKDTLELVDRGVQPAAPQDPTRPGQYEILYEENERQARFYLWHGYLRKLETTILISLGFAADAEFKGKKDREAALLAVLTESGLSETTSKKIIKRVSEKALRFEQ